MTLEYSQLFVRLAKLNLKLGSVEMAKVWSDEARAAALQARRARSGGSRKEAASHAKEARHHAFKAQELRQMAEKDPGSDLAETFRSAATQHDLAARLHQTAAAAFTGSGPLRRDPKKASVDAWHAGRRATLGQTS